MRVRARARWQIECKRVPAENKSALGARSVLEKLVSGMESKISTNTCAPKTGILKSSNSFNWRGKAANMCTFSLIKIMTKKRQTASNQSQEDTSLPQYDAIVTNAGSHKSPMFTTEKVNPRAGGAGGNRS